MASLIAKKKGNQLYSYVVESARVDGQPRIVHQSYLGSAEKVAALVRDRTAPVPLSATMRDFGLPGALWLAAQQTGVFDLLQQLWPQPRSGPRVSLPGSARRIGASAVAVVRVMETEAVGQPPLAGLRHHQLLHLHRQHQHTEPSGPTRPQ